LYAVARRAATRYWSSITQVDPSGLASSAFRSAGRARMVAGCGCARVHAGQCRSMAWGRILYVPVGIARDVWWMGNSANARPCSNRRAMPRCVNARALHECLERSPWAARLWRMTLTLALATHSPTAPRGHKPAAASITTKTQTEAQDLALVGDFPSRAAGRRGPESPKMIEIQGATRTAAGRARRAAGARGKCDAPIRANNPHGDEPFTARGVRARLEKPTKIHYARRLRFS